MKPKHIYKGRKRCAITIMVEHYIEVDMDGDDDGTIQWYIDNYEGLRESDVNVVSVESKMIPILCGSCEDGTISYDPETGQDQCSDREGCGHGWFDE